MTAAKSTKPKPADLENQLKRALADYQNLKKRLEKEKHDYTKYANASLIDKLLAVLDDFERAQKHLQNSGLKLTINQFKAVLQAEGVELIKTLNKTFDPQIADCIDIVPGKKNQVIQVVKKGYTLNGQVLRPAQVKVGKGG